MSVRVQVCRGMSCSCNGGGRPLEDAFEAALTEAGIMDQIVMLSAHCMGECGDGPCIRINGQKFYQISREDIPQLIRSEILPLLDIQ